MTVQALDHVNIRTTELDALVRFFGILGMEARPSPGRETMAQGAWIHDGSGRAAFHLSAIGTDYPGDADRPFAPVLGSGSIHHVALRCTDHDAMAARLAAAGLTYRTNAVPRLGLTQLFVVAPGDLLFELNFADG